MVFIPKGGAKNGVDVGAGADGFAELRIGFYFCLNELEGIEVLRRFFNGVFRPEKINFLIANGGERITAANEDNLVRPIARLLKKFPLATWDRVFIWLKAPSGTAQNDFFCGMAVFPIEDPAPLCVLC